MSIYETVPTVDHRLRLRMQTLIEQIATTDDPELLVEFHEAMDEAGESLSEHIHMLGRHITELENSQIMIRHEIDRLAELHNERGIRAERLKATIAKWMAAIGQRSYMFDDMTLRVKMNPPAVNIYDIERLPSTYIKRREIVEEKPDKNMIKDALKAGIDVPGCELTQSEKLEIK